MSKKQQSDAAPKGRIKNRVNKLLRDFRKKAFDLPAKLQEEINGPFNSQLWTAFANKNCNRCFGRGICKIVPPNSTVKTVPCQCSITQRAKIYKDNDKQNLVWRVIRKDSNGVETIENTYIKNQTKTN